MKGSFFCDACGAEVKGGAQSCPSCGRSFLGIRCPRCGREGSSSDFKNGCPGCGYLSENIENSEDVEWDILPLVPEKKTYRNHSDWPASRYWILSLLVVTALGWALYLWLR